MRRSSLFFVLFFLFVLACQVSEEEKIDRMLNQRQEALQKKDLPLYLSCISKAYQDKEEDFTRLQKRIGGYFKTFDRISYSSWDRSFRIDGEDAVVTQQFYLEVEKAGKKNHYSGKEVLYLKKEGKDWKIIKGL
jgi:ketosteroid isomerase-like protein